MGDACFPNAKNEGSRINPVTLGALLSTSSNLKNGRVTRPTSAVTERVSGTE